MECFNEPVYVRKRCLQYFGQLKQEIAVILRKTEFKPTGLVELSILTLKDPAMLVI